MAGTAERDIATAAAGTVIAAPAMTTIITAGTITVTRDMDSGSRFSASRSMTMMIVTIADGEGITEEIGSAIRAVSNDRPSQFRLLLFFGGIFKLTGRKI